MRVNLFSLFCVCLFISCQNTETKRPLPTLEKAKVQDKTNQYRTCCTTLRDFDRLNGRVKSMKSSTFHAAKKKQLVEKVMLGNAYSTTYDEQGNGKEKLYFNSANKLQTRTVYEQVSGKCNRAKVYQGSSIFKTIEYQFDPQNNLIEEIQYNPSHVIQLRQKYRYNENHLLSEELKYTGSGQLDMRMTYQYNRDGHLIETIYFRPMNTIIVQCKTMYTSFDQYGNWLRSVEQTDKGSVFIVERSITYYP